MIFFRSGCGQLPAYAPSDNVGRVLCLPSRNGRISVGQRCWEPFTVGVGICRKEKLSCAVSPEHSPVFAAVRPNPGPGWGVTIRYPIWWVDPPQRADTGETGRAVRCPVLAGCQLQLNKPRVQGCKESGAALLKTPYVDIHKEIYTIYKSAACKSLHPCPLQHFNIHTQPSPFFTVSTILPRFSFAVLSVRFDIPTCSAKR